MGVNSPCKAQCLLDDYQPPHARVGQRPLSPAGAGRVRGVPSEAPHPTPPDVGLTRPRSSGTLFRKGRGLSSPSSIGFATRKCADPMTVLCPCLQSPLCKTGS
jgi:hypothetical protein